MMRGAGVGVVVLLLLGGCGVYGVDLRPSPNELLAFRPQPLDLTVSLGEVETYANGSSVPLDPATLAELDARFVRAGRGAGFFRDVRPRGTATDLVCDVTSRLHAAPTTVGRSAYLFLAGPLAVLTPGFPHPWDYRIEREVRVWGKVGGTSIALRRHRLAYDERIWGAGYWGGLGADPLREADGEYLFAALVQAVNDQPSLFRSFETAARTEDVEGAWLLGERASAGSSAF